MSPRGNGHGRGRGRGSSPFRGRPGRGQQFNRGRGGRGGGQMYRDLDIIDVDIQRYADDIPTSGTVSPSPQARGRGYGRARGRGRGRGSSTPLNLQVYNDGYRTPPPPRRADGSGRATPVGRGAGRGPSRGLGARYNPNMPLSKLLALDRPYLRPISFVPAQITPVLFQREEELIEVHEFQEPEDHVPTAEQVSRVFSHQESLPPPQDSFFQGTEVDLFAETESVPVITVDFNSLGKLMVDAPLSQAAPVPDPESINSAKPMAPAFGYRESIFGAIKEALSIRPGEVMNASPSANVQVSEAHEPNADLVQRNEREVSIATSQETVIRNAEPVEELEEAQGDEQRLFVMDGNPIQPSERQERVAYIPTSSDSQPLGSQLPDDDEVIVYVAPHPRSRRPTPSTPSVDAAGVTGNSNTASLSLPASAKRVLSMPVHPRVSSPTISENIWSQPSTTSHPIFSTKAPPPTLPFVGESFSVNTLPEAVEINRQQTASPRARRLTKRDRQTRSARRNGKKDSSFMNYGAMLEEMHLQEDEFGPSDRRGGRGGSDIDWGDNDSGSEAPVRAAGGDPEIERVSSGLGGMTIDGGLDMKAMEGFVRSMSNKGMEHASIDDIKDAERLRLEDKENEDSSSGSEEVDSEVAAILKAEEERLIGEADNTSDLDSESDEVDEDDVSSDDDETPVQSFQTRLTQVRQSAKAKGKMKESAFSAAQASPSGLFGARMSKLRERSKPQAEESDEDDDSDDSDDFNADFTWAEADDDYINDIQDLLDENDILQSDRKQRKMLFKSVLNGDFSVAPAKKKRDYGNDLPPQLRAQWEKDRAKKAENKRRRAAARLEASIDPFAQHNGGKKGRKAMLRASQLAAEARGEAPRDTGPDIVMIVHQMRTYLNNINLTIPIALPPMDKECRAQVHEIAAAFGLKSQSKGKGAARYTTLIKTSRSGIRIDERKVERIMRKGSNWGFTRPGTPGAGGRKTGGAPKHKEGDEVGKAAPKIGQTNVGFRMLAGMGWSEGEKIGVSGGIDAPLMAIIKHSKLGLGATR